MKKGLRNVLVVLGAVVVVLAVAIFVMGRNAGKLADSFDEETVKQQAQDDIVLAEADDFQGWKERFSPALQDKITESSYTQYLETLEKNGEFKEFGKIAIAGQEKDGKNYAIAVAIVKHEKSDIKYTLVYDEEMNLISFLI